MLNSQSIPADKSSQKLPRTRILSHRGWVQKVFESGKRYHHRVVSLFELPLPESTPPAGVVAFLSPKKVGKAHERNKVRRWMKEIYRRELQSSHSNCFWIWLAKPAMESECFEVVQEAMHQLAQRSQTNRISKPEVK